MSVLGSLLYLIIFYVCLCLFLWNFNSFSFQEKVIVALIISGFQCISTICGREK